MTTMTTLNDVRAAMIARGYPAEEVDAMLDLAGRMMLEGNLASKDDLNALRDEFAQFKIEVAERFAQLRVEMHESFAELRVEMNGKFAEQRTEMLAMFAEQRSDSDARERRIIKWVAGAVIGGIAVNVAILGIGIAIVALLVR